jgi:hypothetical protein
VISTDTVLHLGCLSDWIWSAIMKVSDPSPLLFPTLRQCRFFDTFQLSVEKVSNYSNNAAEVDQHFQMMDD